MDSLLQFFSDLLLMTAGLAVVAFWILLIVGLVIEIHDFLTEGSSTPLDEEDPF